MKGWKIVCPDGKERHFPYINLGDAAFDASVHTARSGGCESDPSATERDGACTGGKHEVIPCVIAKPQAPPGMSRMSFERRAEMLAQYIEQLPDVNPVKKEALYTLECMKLEHDKEVAQAERNASVAKTDPAPPPFESVPPVVTQYVTVHRLVDVPAEEAVSKFWQHPSGRELLEIAHRAEPRRVEFLLTDLNGYSVATDLHLHARRSGSELVPEFRLRPLPPPSGS